MSWLSVYSTIHEKFYSFFINRWKDGTNFVSEGTKKVEKNNFISTKIVTIFKCCRFNPQWDVLGVKSTLEDHLSEMGYWDFGILGFTAEVGPRKYEIAAKVDMGCKKLLVATPIGN